MGPIVTLPAEATGSAPGRGRLTGRRVLVVGAGTRPSPEPDPPIGNGRAISVLAAREGAAVACADRDAGAAEATAALVRNEGQIALPALCRQVAREGMARGIRANLVVPSLVDTPLGWEASRLNPGRTARSLPFGLAGDGLGSGLRHGTQTVEEGAEIIVRMAQVGPDGPTGGYVGAGGPLPW